MLDQRIDEITTNVRFCQYKSGDKNAAKELRNMRMKAALDDPEMTRVLDVRCFDLMLESIISGHCVSGFSQRNASAANIVDVRSHLATTKDSGD